jgi:RNA polymerase sporulation-specific sigma factor
MYEKHSDEELVEKFRDGDAQAQEYLISKYKPLVKLKTKAFFIAGADRDDLIQEGMIGLFKAIRDFRAEKKIPFGAFADMCVARQIITAIKSATRKKHMPLNSYVSLNKQIFESRDESSFESTFIENLPDASLSPEDALIGREVKNFLENFIKASLSELESKVLELHLAGKSYGQIAEIINKDEKSIDNSIQRIRKKIGAALKTN